MMKEKNQSLQPLSLFESVVAVCIIKKILALSFIWFACCTALPASTIGDYSTVAAPVLLSVMSAVAVVAVYDVDGGGSGVDSFLPPGPLVALPPWNSD